MARNIIEIVIKAQDQASAQLLKVQNASAGFVDKIKGIALPAGIAMGAVYGIVASINKLIDVYREVERADIRLKTTLESLGNVAQVSGRELDAMTDKYYAASLLHHADIKNAEARLLRFGNIRRELFGRAIQTAIDMAAADGDLEAQIRRLGVALENPMLGMTRLRREGVVFSDAEEKIVKHMMELNQIAEAQEVIMRKLNEQFGGQAQAQLESYTGEIDSWKRSWKELWEDIGKTVTEALVKLNKFMEGGPAETPRIRWLKDVQEFFKQTGGKGFKVEFETGKFKLSDFARVSLELQTQEETAKKLADEYFRVQNITGMLVRNEEEYQAALHSAAYELYLEEESLKRILKLAKARREVPKPEEPEIVQLPIKSAEEQAEKWESTMSLVKQDFEELPEVVDEAAEAIERAAEAADLLYRRFDFTTLDLATSITQTLGQAFGSLFDTATNRAQAWANLFRSLLADIASQLASMAIWKWVMLPIFFNKGGEIPGAQYGLETVGGYRGRDTIPAMLSSGEAVIPSPTVTRLNRFMDEWQGRRPSMNLYTLFYSGSRDEANQAGSYILNRERNARHFVVQGTL